MNPHSAEAACRGGCNKLAVKLLQTEEIIRKSDGQMQEKCITRKKACIMPRSWGIVFICVVML